MSDVSQGAGWWQASDRKWYPPEARSASEAAEAGGAAPEPSVRPQGAPDLAPTVPGGAPEATEQAGGVPDAGPATLPDGPKRSSFVRNPALVTVAILVLVIAVVGGGIYAVFGGTTSATSSTGSVASATLADLGSGNYDQTCTTLALPGQTSKCASDLKQLTLQHVTYTNLAVGTITTSGNRAVFVIIGRVCVGSTGRCLSNQNRNVDTGHTFNQLYASAIGTTNSSPFLLPLIRQSGHWYVTGF